MTELEMAMTDWLGRAIGLPECYMNSDSGLGAGMIQSTASDATFIALLSARGQAVDVIFFLYNSKLNLRKFNDLSLRFQQIKTAKENHENESWVQTTFNKAVDKINVKNVVFQRLLSTKMFSNNDSEKNKSSNVAHDVSLNAITTFRNHDPAVFQKFIAYASDQVSI